MVYPTEPHLERHHHCREHFTLDKWTQLACYAAPIVEPPQAEEVSQVEHSTESLPHAPTPPMPEVPSTIPLPTPATPTTMLVPKSTSTTPLVPPAVSASSTPQPFMTISATEFHAMISFFKTLTRT